MALKLLKTALVRTKQKNSRQMAEIFSRIIQILIHRNDFQQLNGIHADFYSFLKSVADKVPKSAVAKTAK